MLIAIKEEIDSKTILVEDFNFPFKSIDRDHSDRKLIRKHKS